MSIPNTAHNYLSEQKILHHAIRHQPSKSSVQIAITAQIPLHQLAKTIVLKDNRDHYLMAILPAANRVNIHQVSQITNSRLQLATEHELNCTFKDCEPGAIPPLGQPYHMNMVFDNRICQSSDIYLESGDHETLTHLLQNSFQQLISGHHHDDLCSAPPKNM